MFFDFLYVGPIIRHRLATLLRGELVKTRSHAPCLHCALHTAQLTAAAQYSHQTLKIYRCDVRVVLCTSRCAFLTTWCTTLEDIVVCHVCGVAYVQANKKPSCRQDSRPYWLTAPLWVSWRHRSRDHLISHMRFPIGGPVEPSLYL